jgi:hypothetical protein
MEYNVICRDEDIAADFLDRCGEHSQFIGPVAFTAREKLDKLGGERDKSESSNGSMKKVILEMLIREGW